MLRRKAADVEPRQSRIQGLLDTRSALVEVFSDPVHPTPPMHDATSKSQPQMKYITTKVDKLETTASNTGHTLLAVVESLFDTSGIAVLVRIRMCTPHGVDIRFPNPGGGSTAPPLPASFRVRDQCTSRLPRDLTDQQAFPQLGFAPLQPSYQSIPGPPPMISTPRTR